MKKYFLVIFLLGFIPVVGAQEDKELYSFSFENKTLLEAIHIIEDKTEFVFYYDSNWIVNQANVSKTYQNEELEEILQDLLQETSLNSVIVQNKIILTNNNLVYNELPRNFFKTDSVAVVEEEENVPVFYQEFDAVQEEVPQEEEQVVSFIGKETKGASTETHRISGYVRDAASGRPIPFATISNKEGNINSISDEEGFYSMVLPTGLNILEVSSVGFKKRQQRLMLYNDGEQNFNLTESVNQLEEVLIAADSKKNVRSAVTGISTIDMEEMKNIPMVLGERDVIKVATIMPGVKTVGEGAAGFNVRGGQSDQNLILLDEAVLYNPFHFLGFFSAVNPYVIKSADVYKGSIPAEHGGRLSSVFDITTKQPNLEKFSGEGGIGPVTSNLTASIPVVKEKAGLLLGGRATYSDWILKSMNEGELQDSEASFYDALVKYHHKIGEKDDLNATFYYSDDRFSITSDSLYNYNNLLVSVGWNHRFNDDHKAELHFTNSQYKFDINYEPETNNNAFDFGYTLSESQIKLKLDYRLSEKHNLSYGIASKLYKVNPGTFNPISAESQLEPLNIDNERGLESALFLSDSYKLSEDLLVNAGLRYSFFNALGPSEQRIYQEGLPKNDASVIGTEQYDNNEVLETYGGLEYRLSARYFLRDDLSIKGSFDTNNQYIHLLSTNTTQSPTDTWKLSDLNVAPQRSQQYSLGVYKNFERDMYELSIEGYYKKMKNMLDYKVGANILLNENLETELLQGDGKAYGVEVLLRKTRGDLNGWLGYTYSRSFLRLDSEFPEERVNNGNLFPTNFDKPHDFNAVLNYKLTKRYSFSANFVYQTGRPVTYPVGSYTYNGAEYTLYSDRNQFRIPDYYRLDLGINIEGNHKIKKLAHSFWNISVYNVLGRNNPYSVYFVTENGEIKGYQTSIFSIPVPTITYNFKF